MKRLKIKLKQHTPLIHFQHDQEGATLRASEVKPKLDRFIISKLGEKYYDGISDDEYEEVATIFEKENKQKKSFDDISQKEQEFEVGKYVAHKKKWIIGKNGDALNYKMRIQSDSGSTRSEYMLVSYVNDRNMERLRRQGIMPISNSPFFAQEKENREIYNANDPVSEWNNIGKKGVFESGTINIAFLCLNNEIENDLFDFLSTNIQPFFISTNFGTRQTKGFGSFSVIEIKYDDRLIPLTNNEDLLKQNFQFVYKKNDTDYSKQPHSRFKGIFSTINDDYKLLKSGRRGRNYLRSKVMLFADNAGYKWDKRFIKKEFNAIPNNHYSLKSEHRSNPANNDEMYLYYRALLGLAEQFEFLLDNQPAGNKMIVKVSPNDSEIQRYQSPLLFKVIGNDIYIVGNEVCADMLGKTFKFQMTIPNDKNWRTAPVTINTPSSFKLKDFIRFAMRDNLNYIKLK